MTNKAIFCLIDQSPALLDESTPSINKSLDELLALWMNGWMNHLLHQFNGRITRFTNTSLDESLALLMNRWMDHSLYQ